MGAKMPAGVGRKAKKKKKEKAKLLEAGRFPETVFPPTNCSMEAARKGGGGRDTGR